MKMRLLKRDYSKAIKDLEGQFPDRSHVTETLNENMKLVALDGRTVAVLICNAVPSAFHKLAFELWHRVRELPDNRATTVGSPSLPRITSNGTLGDRKGVPTRVLKVLAEQGTAHGLIGYLDATPNHGCHKTPLTKKHPEMLHGNEKLVKLVDALYKQHEARSYAKQQIEIEKVPRWRLWNTAFSTIYIAKNFRTAYHRDSGNLKSVMTALIPMGKFTGGELVFPRWRLAIALRPGDLLLFNPQELHGNLPFTGERLSAAFYCERRIADCGK